MSENVNHPKHYKGATSMECIEAMELMLGQQGIYSFCLGNAFKYIWRHKNKNGKEDLEKALWYLDWASCTKRDEKWYRLNRMVHRYLDEYPDEDKE